MLIQLHAWAFMLLAGGGVGFDVRSMWAQMGFAAKAVVVLLFLMSAYSIGIMIDRFLAYSAARKQSRQFSESTANLERPPAAQILTAQLAVTREKQGPVRRRKPADRRQHRLRTRIERRSRVGEFQVHG